MPWSALFSIGLSGAETYSQGNLNYDQSQAQIKNIDEMLGNFSKQKEQLLEAYDLRKQITTDLYGNRIKSLYSQTGRSLFDINRQSDKTLSKTGLAYSGDVEEERGFASSGVKSDFEFSRKELMGKKGEEFADIEMKKTQDITAIDNAMAQLRGQKDIHKKTRSGLMELIDPGGFLGQEWGDETSEWSMAIGEPSGLIKSAFD